MVFDKMKRVMHWFSICTQMHVELISSNIGHELNDLGLASLGQNQGRLMIVNYNNVLL